MNERERFLATCEFKTVDRVPNHEMNPWSKTLSEWYSQGLKQDCIYGDFMSGEPYFNMDRRYFLPIWVQLSPMFEHITIEETERHEVFIDPSGATRKIIKGSQVGAAQGQHLKDPVIVIDDFKEIKKRYNPYSLTRYPLFWELLVNGLKERDFPVCLLTNPGVPGDGNFGFYSMLRRWMGVENLSCAFYEEPDFIHEMLDFLLYFFIETIKKAVTEIQIDYFNFFEDMSFKNGPLVSPEIFKNFFVPRYKKAVDFLNSYGIRNIWVDSDGNCDDLIPGWLDAGINGLWPLEQVPGMDPREVRKKYGKNLVLAGGLNKYVLFEDKKAIEDEVTSKIPPLIEQGGYIPMLDHDCPPGVPLENFLYYMELKKKLIGFST